MGDYRIAYDKTEDTYYVYETFEDRAIIYKGTYTQCLVVVGALSLDSELTINDIRTKSEGFI